MKLLQLFKFKKYIALSQVKVDKLLLELRRRKGAYTIPINFNPKSSFDKHFSERYTLESPISDDGKVAIFKAFDQYLSREVFVKVLSIQDEEADPLEYELFLREIKILSYLSHPFIPIIFDYGKTKEGRLAFATRYLEPVSLDNIFAEIFFTYKMKKISPKKEKMALILRLEYFLKICDILIYVHDQGIVHGKITPSHISIDKQRNTYISLWRGAGFTGEKQRYEALQEEIRSKYCAPELEKDHILLYSCDIYSMGMILADFVTLMTDQEPIYDEEEGVFVHQNEEIRIDKRLSAIIKKAIEPILDKRYQHISDLKDDVLHFLYDDEIKICPDSFLVRLNRQIRINRRRIAYWFIGIFVTICCAMLLISLAISLNLTFFQNKYERDLAFLTKTMSIARAADYGFDRVISCADLYCSSLAINYQDIQENNIQTSVFNEEQFSQISKTIIKQQSFFQQKQHQAQGNQIQRIFQIYAHWRDGTNYWIAIDPQNKPSEYLKRTIKAIVSNNVDLEKSEGIVLYDEGVWKYGQKHPIKTPNNYLLGFVIIFVHIEEGLHELIEYSLKDPNSELYISNGKELFFQIKNGKVQYGGGLPNSLLNIKDQNEFKQIKTIFTTKTSSEVVPFHNCMINSQHLHLLRNVILTQVISKEKYLYQELNDNLQDITK